ncbi:TetR/AcrR family transcriptional regulator [Mycobacterium sp. CVI_P3]|uniref:TetR/AcrR family transcriptional regulator n=1 Tax=Mycobacterium pinniadriaticum TaxID=2994102 RepID=A0ABT3S845_9MYCO|nr:TetR/AcrR family transcriptional regulator [Mycobacterium pinniadriaticum]MCX2929041.1 TetR/AcrR family transcriptional regulator [Mycobacterium pinniadriaticum]MCX2935092.1 TetR/AcrR family transcriptional regulator [Mycobacterium pinniadriaticum]
MTIRRTQAERSATTQEALRKAARELWGERGYAEVGTPEIAQRAGVTRGAMYHQYADKAALFLDVVEAVEADVMSRLAAATLARQPSTPAAALHAAVDAWLDISAEREIRQLILLDAPNILGWDGFRDVAERYSLGMTEQLLQAAMDAGELRTQPVRPLAHILIGALDAAAMTIANSAEPEITGAEVRTALHGIVNGMLAGHDRPAG